MDESTFIAALDDAVSGAVAAFAIRRPGHRLAGLALCTDDDLCTLCPMAVSAEDVERSPHQDLLFQPTEWQIDVEYKEVREVDLELQRRSEETSSFPTYVDETFAALVSALHRARASGLVEAGVFLTVLSTDPSEKLSLLEDEAVRVLNVPTLAAARWEYISRFR